MPKIKKTVNFYDKNWKPVKSKNSKAASKVAMHIQDETGKILLIVRGFLVKERV